MQPDLRVESVGTDAYNQRLSEQASTVTAQGFGESKPKVFNDTATAAR